MLVSTSFQTFFHRGVSFPAFSPPSLGPIFNLEMSLFRPGPRCTVSVSVEGGRKGGKKGRMEGNERGREVVEILVRLYRREKMKGERQLIIFSAYSFHSYTSSLLHSPFFFFSSPPLPRSFSPFILFPRHGQRVETSLPQPLNYLKLVLYSTLTVREIGREGERKGKDERKLGVGTCEG